MADASTASYSLSDLLTAPDAAVTPGDVLGVGALSLIIGLSLFFNGFRIMKKKRLIENTPTSKTRSVAMGRAEIHGTIVPFQEITMSPFSATPCVYFRYSLERQHEWRDKNGKVHQRWDNIDSGRWSVPFYVQDDSGKILVDPKRAQVDTGRDRVNWPLLTLEVPPNVASRVSLGKYDVLRYSESFIRPGETLYVLGFAGDNPHVADTSQDSAAGDKMIQHRAGEPFYISDQRQEDILTYNASASRQSIVAGAVLGAAGLLAAIYALTLY